MFSASVGGERQGGQRREGGTNPIGLNRLRTFSARLGFYVNGMVAIICYKCGGQNE
jgi:hypothetical protein